MPSSTTEGSSSRLHFQPGHLHLSVYPAEPRHFFCSFTPNQTTCPSCEATACTWVEFNKHKKHILEPGPQTEISLWQDLQKFPHHS